MSNDGIMLTDVGGDEIPLTFVTRYGIAPDSQSVGVVFQSGYNYTEIGTYDSTQDLTFPYASFLGWYASETYDESKKVYVKNSTLCVNGDLGTPSSITLYAKWEPTERHLVSAMDVYALAEAVRAAAGTTAGMLPQDIPAAIRALAGGGLISFTIGGTAYNAETDMTWAEWVESKHNTGGFAVNGSYIGKGASYVYITKAAFENYVIYSDIIEVDGVYVLSGMIVPDI